MSPAEQDEKKQAAAVVEETTAISWEELAESTKLPDKEADDVLGALIDQLMSDQITVSKSVLHSLKEREQAIDRMLSKQLSAIMHHPSFQKLEGSWRGLNYTVMNTETATDLKIKVLNAAQNELLRDFEKASEFDQSMLWKKLYETEYGQAGGIPYGALVADYEFTNHNDDISLLTELTQVAASSFTPLLSAASPALFGMDSWQDLNKPRDLAKVFDNSAYIKWQAFRDSEDSRFAYLTMPRTQARDLYGSNTKPIEEFQFEEAALGERGQSVAVEHGQFCWMNTAYVLATRLTDAYSRTGFCVAIRGYSSGGQVEDLPAYIFETDEGDLELKCPIETQIPDRRLAELDKLGFLPLAHYKNTDYAVFFGAQSVQKPKYFGKKKDVQFANENAQISARLPYIMAMSRIAHFLKVIARDKIGDFMERSDCEKWLNNWIAEYVSTGSPSKEEKATYPLAEAKVEVSAIPGKPGAYNAVCYLRPWLQLEELNAAMSLVTEIPTGK
jgi:type VI secretion system protein ImpC